MKRLVFENDFDLRHAFLCVSVTVEVDRPKSFSSSSLFSTLRQKHRRLFPTEASADIIKYNTQQGTWGLILRRGGVSEGSIGPRVGGRECRGRGD